MCPCVHVSEELNAQIPKLELQEARRRHRHSLQLDLQAVVSHPMEVLGTKPRNPQEQNRLLASRWISSSTDGPLTTTLTTSSRSALAQILRVVAQAPG